MPIEPVHIEGNDPRWNMPYTAGIKVNGGSLVFVSGVTAAPVYHSHPHVPAEFGEVPAAPVARQSWPWTTSERCWTLPVAVWPMSSS